MWFKQLQLFQLHHAIDCSPVSLTDKLTPFAFRACLPSMPSSIGWVSPIGDDTEEAPLYRAMNGYVMLCLQVEEKILPATVIAHELANKVKHLELTQNRKIRQSEKNSLKDEIMMTLLPRAFSKFTKIFAYIDSKHQRIIVGSANEKKAEQFISLFKKSLTDNVSSLDINKLSPIITHWLKHQDYPTSLSLEKSCVLQDPNEQSRIIRCQQQDLFTISIQSLIKDGCEVKQLAVNWQDRVSFVLADNFSLKSIKFHEDVIAQANDMEPETKEQCFDADFFIMTETFLQILEDLLGVFAKKSDKAEALEPV